MRYLTKAEEDAWDGAVRRIPARTESESARYLSALLAIASGKLDAESCIRVAREATEPR